MSLTDTALKALKPKDASCIVSDDRGLYVEVLPSGSIVWRYRYRLDGKREKLTLGKYPALTLKSAVIVQISFSYHASDKVAGDLGARAGVCQTMPCASRRPTRRAFSARRRAISSLWYVILPPHVQTHPTRCHH